MFIDAYYTAGYSSFQLSHHIRVLDSHLSS